MINTEMVAITSMVLQNRFALDILLAKEGGVCVMLKVQNCCTYIPDKSKEIGGYIKNITKLHEKLKPLEVDSVWERLTKIRTSIGTWFADIGKSPVGQIILPLVGIIIIIVLVIMILCNCCRNKGKRRKYEINEKGKKRKRENKDIEMEEMKGKIYKKMRDLENKGEDEKAKEENEIEEY